MDTGIDCTFCKIVAGQLPASVVRETERFFCFLDLHPVQPGHTLIVPKQHVELFTELPAELSAELAQMAQAVAQQLKRALPQCSGFTYSIAEGVAAHQEVPHVHLHVIPRAPDDGFGWKFPSAYGAAASRSALDELAARLREAVVRPKDGATR